MQRSRSAQCVTLLLNLNPLLDANTILVSETAGKLFRAETKAGSPRQLSSQPQCDSRLFTQTLGH
jgi:hypothetical protein